MPKKRAPRTPKLCRHPDGRAYVRIRGKFHYLGAFGSPEATQRYHALLAERLVLGAVGPQSDTKKPPTVALALAEYMDYARGYYAQAGGKSGGHIDRIKTAILCACDLYGAELAENFGPLKLRGVQGELIMRGYSRTNINLMIGCLRLAFKWLASHEKIPASVPMALGTVPGLRAGKTPAKETEPVGPVAVADVEATLPHLAPPVAAMVQLQLLTGCRPGEIVRVRPCDVDTGGDVWVVTLEDHKTAYRGRQRTIMVGPKAQAILRPYLLRGKDAYCFSPREAVAALAAAKPTHRHGKQKPTPRRTRRTLGERYDVPGYRRAIARAVAKANRAAETGGPAEDRGLAPQPTPAHRGHPHSQAVRARSGASGPGSCPGRRDADICRDRPGSRGAGGEVVRIV
jgi:integrase